MEAILSGTSSQFPYFTPLLGEGRNPTVEQVRLFIGSGSSTTIASHLKKWREEQGRATSFKGENMPTELMAIVKGLWERLLMEADGKVKKIEKDAKAEKDFLEVELQKYKSNNQRWQQMYNTWVSEKEGLITEKTKLDKVINTLNEKNANLSTDYKVLQKQMAEKDQRIQELHQLHRQQQKNLEHYREESHQERLKEQTRHEENSRVLQLNITNLKKENHSLTETIFNNQVQLQNFKEANSNLEKNKLKNEALLDKSQSELRASENKINKYEQESNHWQKQYKDSQEDLALQTAENIEKIANIKFLNEKMKELKQELTNMQITLAKYKRKKHITAKEIGN